MSQDETYDDKITLQAIAQLYNVHIRVELRLCPQSLRDISKENGKQTLISRHFAEGQSDLVICLRQNTTLDYNMMT